MNGELYGLANSNRVGSDLWGKNQFNSTFPMALCCFMRDAEIKPIYISFEEDGTFRTSDDEVTIASVLGTASTSLRFEFEAEFPPIRHLFADGNTQSIDVVTSHVVDGKSNPLKALEVKLTVLPDDTTSERSEDEWSSELVIRPVTSAYAMLMIWNRLPISKQDLLRNIVEPFITGEERITHWDSKKEIIPLAHKLHDSLSAISKLCSEYQEPFLVQPVWKTKGKTPELAENCFDVFVWSDLATVMLPHDLSKGAANLPVEKRKLGRPLREAIRHICCIVKLTNRAFIFEDIYGGMGFGKQTDKSFSISGARTIKYMKHPRLHSPILRANVLPDVIIGGGENNLSPERRFDATIYFTARGLMRS